MLERGRFSYAFLSKTCFILVLTSSSTITTSTRKSTGIAKSNKRKLQIEKAVLFGNAIVDPSETVRHFFTANNPIVIYIGIFCSILYIKTVIFFSMVKKTL